MAAAQWMLSATSGISWESASSGWEISLRVAAAVAVIALAAFALRRWGQIAGGRFPGRSRLRIVDGVTLGPQRAVYVVRVGRRALVVGVTQQHVNLLVELSPEEADELDVAASSARGEPFRNVFRRHLRSNGGPTAREPGAGEEDTDR